MFLQDNQCCNITIGNKDLVVKKKCEHIEWKMWTIFPVAAGCNRGIDRMQLW
jgi:hypothetical protein